MNNWMYSLYALVLGVFAFFTGEKESLLKRGIMTAIISMFCFDQFQTLNCQK